MITLEYHRFNDITEDTTIAHVKRTTDPMKNYVAKYRNCVEYQKLITFTRCGYRNCFGHVNVFTLVEILFDIICSDN